MTVTTHTHHADALDGAEFVISAIEVPPREKLWRSDYEITLKHGVRQPYAENGGPGGFAHAARNIGPVMEIARDIEQACPDAWFINYTNPMMRICDAIARYSTINVVGLCHQIHAGYGMVGLVLADVLEIEVPDAANATVHLRWVPPSLDPAVIAELTYNVYRVPAVDGDEGTERLLVSGLTAAEHTDDGSVSVDPGGQAPLEGTAPLPPGSLTYWRVAVDGGGAPILMNEAREGLDAEPSPFVSPPYVSSRYDVNTTSLPGVP